MTQSAQRQPAIFLPHGGGPCFFMDWTWGPADTWVPTQRFLEGIANALPEKPKALLVISGHWEERAFTASAARQPELIFDYSGFPDHTYKLTWPAPGHPDLAHRVAQMLRDADLPAGITETRGYDHGVFVPLKVAFPLADIPVVTLSLMHDARGSFDAALHIRAGRALMPLRDEGVLIVGSGMSFHNLRAYFRPETQTASRAFDAWLTRAIEQTEPERAALLAQWETAPGARFAHPREEHLAPLFVASGAGGEGPGKRVFTDEPMGAQISAYRFDG
ncbi:MAG: DODA-type extradiol aromatic ring-opening family dioxygenase [Acidobacteriota bacterium]